MRCVSFALSLLILVSAASIGRTAEVLATEVTVAKMCPTCAKKISQKLQKLPGARAAWGTVETRIYRVEPSPGALLSPRAVWETIEAGGERPTSLRCPTGTFSEKPEA